MDERLDLTNKTTHLQMIQGVIGRMSSSSAIYKGFSATIITGISAVSFTDINPWILLMAFCPVICFFVMDLYYFRLERKYRILYEKVRSNEIVSDFSMDVVWDQSTLSAGKATWSQCIKAPCIVIFYLPVLAIGTAIVVMKFCGVI